MSRHAITVTTSYRLSHMVNGLRASQIDLQLADALSILLDPSGNTMDEVACIAADNADEYRAVVDYYQILCRVIESDLNGFIERMLAEGDGMHLSPIDYGVRVHYTPRHWSCLVLVNDGREPE